MSVSKRTAVHAAFLSLMSAVVVQSGEVVAIDRDSLLYSFLSGEKVAEGPLDPSAYAQTDTPGVGGALLAAASATDINLITFDDPEVHFAQTLEGDTLVAPLQPLVPEPGSEKSGTSSSGSNKSHIYTIEDGDTIASIAAKFDISVNTILWANGLSSKEVIKKGDHLTILPTTGVLHTVKSGDTLLAIANEYDAKAEDVLKYNNLPDSSRLSIGQKLIIPDGYIAPRSAPQVISDGSRIAREPNAAEPTPEAKEVTGLGFVWPTTTKHISQYFRWGHTGIDIDNRSRPPVFAAEGGTIEFTGWLGGYGNLIIMNHGGGITTYYAHLDKFYVSKGETVAKGAAIGQMGSTGRSTGPHVHFEVRRNGQPINPLGMY